MNNPNIEGFGWITTPLALVNANYTDTTVENIGHSKSASVNVYGVSPQLFDVTLPGIYICKKKKF
jgi:hypothetical protein